MTTLTLENFSDSILSQEKIDFIRARYAGLRNTGRRLLREAIELGELFNEAALAFKGKKSGQGNKWGPWLRETFPEIAFRSVHEYRKLAANRELLANASADGSIMGIKTALHYIRDHTALPPISGAWAIGNQSALHEGGEPSLEPSAIEPPSEEELLEARLHQYWLIRSELLAQEEAVRLCLKQISLSRKQILTAFARKGLSDCLKTFNL